MEVGISFAFIIPGSKEGFSTYTSIYSYIINICQYMNSFLLLTPRKHYYLPQPDNDLPLYYSFSEDLRATYLCLKVSPGLPSSGMSYGQTKPVFQTFIQI